MKPYPYVHRYKDRHAKVRYYYRRHGKQIAIPFEPGTADFQHAYDLLNDSSVVASPSPMKTKVGTWRWLCAQYFSSMDFQDLDPQTQHVRRLILESTCQELWHPGSSQFFGDAPLPAMTPHAVAVLRDRKRGLPEAARGRLKAISRVFDWAMLPESKISGVTSNPTKSVRRPKEKADGGFHSWTPDEVVKYEQHHPIGTKARLHSHSSSSPDSGSQMWCCLVGSTFATAC